MKVSIGKIAGKLETVSADEKLFEYKRIGFARKDLMSSTFGTCDFLARDRVGPLA
jgi:hypothetical protein